MAADLQSAVASLLQVPGMQELLNQSITQQRQLAPVRTAVAQHAMNTMPSSDFGGGARPNISAIAPANYSTPAPAAGGGFDLMSLLKILGMGGAGALAAKKLLSGNGSGGGGNLSSLGQALKKLVGGHSDSTFGTPAGSTGSDSFGGNLPGFDNFGYFNDPNVFDGNPADPSGGSGVGPGMQQYYSDGGGSDPNAVSPDGGGEDW